MLHWRYGSSFRFVLLTRQIALLFFTCFYVSACTTVINKDNVAVNPSAPQSQTSKDAVREIISNEEKKNGIPSGILDSIAKVESRHNVYAVNTSKKTYNFKTKAEAVKFINTSLRNGCNNISVGCFQLHYATHKKNFVSIDNMLTAEANVMYAANLLRNLHNKYGSWELAIKKYHSSKAKYNNVYYKKVMSAYNSLHKSS